MSTAADPRNPAETIGNIRGFLMDAEALPSPKGTALRLMELARDPDASIDVVVRVIRSDPSVAGFVLRAANAARFGSTDQTLDLNRAVVRLGMNLVRAHALALSMIKDSTQVRCEHFDYNTFWTGSLLTASLMESLARRYREFPAADAFVLGLLSGIGRLAFATAAPAEYARVLERAANGKLPLEALEQAAFGFDHHELSSVLVADWGVPTALADVVYWQCDPEGGGFAPDSRPYRLAGALQLAGALAVRALAGDEDTEGTGAVYLRAALLELSPEELDGLVAESLRDLQEWVRLIGLPAPAVRAAPAAGPK
jgi:HD-like signal output (HDOD) protein